MFVAVAELAVADLAGTIAAANLIASSLHSWFDLDCTDSKELIGSSGHLVQVLHIVLKVKVPHIASFEVGSHKVAGTSTLMKLGAVDSCFRPYRHSAGYIDLTFRSKYQTKSHY